MADELSHRGEALPARGAASYNYTVAAFCLLRLKAAYQRSGKNRGG
jgi:hypothetical protein